MASERSEQLLIQELKHKYNLAKSEDVLLLYSMLQNGEYEFHSKIGRQFDDEIFELAMKAKEEQKNTQKKNKNSKKESRDKKTKVIVYTQKEYRIRKLLMAVLFLGCITCFGYFFFYNYQAYQKNIESQKLSNIKNNETVNDMYKDTVHEVIDEVTGEVQTFKVLEQYKSLYNQNKNLIGWIKIDDTIIDYPVMQTKDNEFYLDHDINQKPDKNGTLFLDSSCDVMNQSTNYIVYGHNMRSGKMFGSLSAYKSPKYYETHPYIQFDTIYEEGMYQVMYVFQSRIYNEDEVVFKYYQFIDANSEDEFNSYMDEMKEISFYDTGVEAVYGDHLLTLSTCDYEEKDGRFVVVAKRIR